LPALATRPSFAHQYYRDLPEEIFSSGNVSYGFASMKAHHKCTTNKFCQWFKLVEPGECSSFGNVNTTPHSCSWSGRYRIAIFLLLLMKFCQDVLQNNKPKEKTTIKLSTPRLPKKIPDPVLCYINLFSC
jgi:hypothetical protein